MAKNNYYDNLSEEQRKIGLDRGTEMAFSSPLNWEKRDGTYRCVVCGVWLFGSDDKFDSGSGWPSFSAVANTEAIKQKTDHSFGMTRQEVSCARCGCHLGHVFPGGPKPGGLRYCINGAMLSFKEDTA